MKEKYLNKNNIDTKTQSIIDGLSQRGRNLSLGIVDTALLVLDMQNFFTSSESHAFVPSSEAIIPRINTLIKVFSEKSMPVIFTIHTNSQSDAGMMGRWWRDMIDPHSESAAINNDITKTDNSITLEKHQYSAFYNTGLDDILHTNGIVNIVITGVMTHLCCDTTARDAFMRGFAPVVAADCCATYSEDIHRASLTALAHGFAPILTSENINDILYEN
jgi:nicotinamidase-related amidase